MSQMIHEHSHLLSLSAGSCRWIRTPAIIYSVHTMTTLIPILASFLCDDFSKTSRFKGRGPHTFSERLTLISIYAPYFLIPLTLLVFMLRNPYYNHEDKRKKKWGNNCWPRREVPYMGIFQTQYRKTIWNSWLQWHLKTRATVLGSKVATRVMFTY